ncbi:helix-turn-helix domain-containing protein [Bacillus sp. 165]|uniref:helix-turn-helix domain-containing protein n=1 Tax=Bacillus sp. 165 TaxID=1529117 RepID=UPI001ADCAEBF|nr:helix-turn-helix domain-containing protein [Bacillus sp. 165]MBO9128275.1 helix-turn-helix domain-containing protein [Bacillus sp. 165]
MLQLQYIILYGLKQLNGERTSASIYHLLKGKRSSQTLQDGKIYHISFLFGLFKKMERHDYDKQINTLLNEKCIKKIQENTYLITSVGEEELIYYAKKYPLPQSLDGLRFADTGEVFWKRLSLLIQTLSHLQNGKRSFSPVQQDIAVTSWTKQFLINNPYKKEKLSYDIYEECRHLLSSMGEVEATIFVLRLSRYGRVGLTIEQIASMLSLEAPRTYILFLSILHAMLAAIEEQPDNYPLLRVVVPNDNNPFPTLSHSTQKTYLLLQQGRRMEEIARMRNLKMNTIEDHIVEIAFNDPSFIIETFVSDKKRKKIIEIATRLQTKKLRQLKKHLGEDVQYFEIRLVLAKLGGDYEA